ncbi:MAG: LPP20 family lipoprotein [Spirochaetaceae bacterium]|nr:LPP20 family lipoprotein [Spirochaetaceae bacterium]
MKKPVSAGAMPFPFMEDCLKTALITVFCIHFLLPVSVYGKPAWIDSPSSTYSEHAYLAAAGGGKSRAAAENAAKINLAAIFKQSVSGTVTITDTEHQRGGKTVLNSNVYSQIIETATALDTLIGVEIKETWNGGKDGWWALAVMDKARGCERYTGELNKIINEIERLVPDGLPALETVKHCDKARLLLADAEVYALILNVIGGGNRQPEIARLAAKVEKTRALAQAMPVDLRISGDLNGRLKAAFAGALSALGLNTGNANARYTLDIDFRLHAAPQNKFYNTRYTLNAVLADSASGTALFTWNVADRQSHPASQQEADNRAILGALRKIEEEFPVLLETYLDSH